MYKFLVSFLFQLVLYIPHSLYAQVFPKEGSALNYRIIGFLIPPAPATMHAQHKKLEFKIDIANGVYNNADSFKNNIIISSITDTNKMIMEVPAFGTAYTWRVTYFINGSPKTSSHLHHFSTLTIPYVDTALTRFRILSGAVAFKDAYVFLDNTWTLYDMMGNAVWFLPDLNATGHKGHPLDLKWSPSGTITALLDFSVFDIDYNGNILWQRNDTTSSGDRENFNHEFTKLSNGHYMALSSEKKPLKLPAPPSGHVQEDTVLEMGFGKLVEYDNKGNIVWSWNTSDYLIHSDLYHCFNQHGGLNIGLHENSFFFDEHNKTIYLSSKEKSRLIKLGYPDGQVTNTYGALCKPGASGFYNDFFCGQHSCKISSDGYLYVFNNNTNKPGIPPTVPMFKQTAMATGGLEKVWEYQCTIDDTSEITDPKPYRFAAGGNVVELPGKSMFVSMGAPYSKVFIVNHNKQILWSAIPEKYDAVSKKWMLVDLYRASIIPSRKDLEQLIWNSEK